MTYDPRPFREHNHLSMREVLEYERLSKHAVLTGRNAIRFVWLHERRVFPVDDPERKGAA